MACLHLGPHLGSVRRPNLLHRNRGKRNHGAEHIALDKLRGPAGIELRVFVSIPYSFLFSISGFEA